MKWSPFLTSSSIINEPHREKIGYLPMRKPRRRSASRLLTAKLISTFVFATGKVQSLFFLNTKFQVSSHLLCLYSPVCVRPVRKPHCWFSHEVAHIVNKLFQKTMLLQYCTQFCEQFIYTYKRSHLYASSHFLAMIFLYTNISSC